MAHNAYHALDPALWPYTHHRLWLTNRAYLSFPGQTQQPDELKLDYLHFELKVRFFS